MIVNDAADERGVWVCVSVFSPFIGTGPLLCRPNSQAADFVLGFQLVIWLSTSATGRGPEYGRVAVTCSGARWSAEAAGLSGALGGYNHFRAPLGCVLGPLAFYSQVYRGKVLPETPTTCLSLSSSAVLKARSVETLVFKAPFPTVTNRTNNGGWFEVYRPHS